MFASQELENVPIRWHLTFREFAAVESVFSNPNRAQSLI
jgi:hypothetical protein